MINLINFIFSLVLFVSLLSLASLCIVLFHKVLYKSTDFFYYKITNFFFTYCIVISYVGYFILFLYALRLCNWSHHVDLKLFWVQFANIFNYISAEITIYSAILVFAGLLLSLILYMLVLMYVSKIAFHHMLMLYIYYIHPHIYIVNNKTFITKIMDKIDNTGWYFYLGHHDPFTSIIIYSLRRFGTMTSKEYHKNGNPDILPKYHPTYIIHWLAFTHREKYKVFIRLSPMFFVIYDCMFNDFIVSIVFKYLIIYIPVMIMHQIYSRTSMPATHISELFMEIYYKKMPYLYAVAENDLKLLQLYLFSGFTAQRLTDNIFDPIMVSELYLKETMVFDVYDSKDKVYWNTIANYIQKMPNDDNTLIELSVNYAYIPEEGEELQEEPEYVKIGRKWILIQDNTAGKIREKGGIPGEMMKIPEELMKF